MTGSNYKEAIEHLMARYDDKEYVIQTYYSSLSEINKATNLTSELRRTFNLIETLLRSLESMGESVNNNYIISLIESKLPSKMNQRLEEVKEDEWNVSSLRKMINKLITARERSEDVKEEEKEECKEDGLSYEYSAEGLFGRDLKLRCIHCGNSHWADECQKYKTIVERKWQLKGKCFVCLSEKHFSRDCSSQKSCFHCKKKGNHHQSLCPIKFSNSVTEEEVPEINTVGDDISINIENEVVMKSARVVVRNKINSVESEANVLLDTGAKRMYITLDKVKELGLKMSQPKSIKLNTFGANIPNDMSICETKICIKEKNGSCKMLNAKVCKTITGIMKRQELNVSMYKHIWKNLDMAEKISTHNGMYKIDLLIGSDYYEDIVKAEKIQVDKGLYLVNSTIGWMFSGRIGDLNDNVDEMELSLLLQDSDEMSKFLTLETIGLSDVTDTMEDELIMKQLKETTILRENRYRVKWPWKLSRFDLPSNFDLCLTRLKSLVKQLQKDKELFMKYDEIIHNQLNDGIIEEEDVSNEYLDKKGVVTHYLPHHLVKNDGSVSSKIRIVYEGCARGHESHKTLNECLYKGKNLVTDLCGVLMRFRMKNIGLVADIKKAYLQLELFPADRDVTRFLWIKDISLPVNKENVRCFRFTRVIWGIVCSAFLLSAVILLHLSKYSDEISSDIQRNLYVDNLITGVSSTQDGIIYYKETKSIFEKAGMNVCQWSSNDKYIMENMKKDDRYDENMIKVLGLIWKIHDDQLSICKFILNDDDVILTKRKMLKIIASVFDPLGFICPILIEAKVLMKDIWKEGLNWDEKVSDDTLNKWKRWLEKIRSIGEFGIDRCINKVSVDLMTNCEIFVFTDASKDAYEAAVYLKIKSGSHTEVNLVMAKARLAPIKPLSIPRLELLGVVIGCRLSRYVAIELGIPDVKRTLYTDSKCVLELHRNGKQLKRFVNDKIQEINSHDIHLYYVRSSDNPADIATRLTTLDYLLQCSLWWKGPKWLHNEINDIIVYTLNDDNRIKIESEERGPKILHEVGMLSMSEKGNDTILGIQAEKFSSYSRLIRVTSWCLRFVFNLRNKDNLKKGHLSHVELEQSLVLWIKHIKYKNFKDLNHCLENGKRHSFYNLGVFKDNDDILKCKGRFSLNINGNPILLPKKDHFTKLIIIATHRKLIHAEIRKRFWILQGRSAVRKVIRQCLICIHWEGGPFKTPELAPIPKDIEAKLSKEPFLLVGLDYLGPLFTSNESSNSKNWLCLFTCLSIRAVHIELVENMTTEGFLMCMRRFIARRGKPKLIVSDNASQLKLGSEIINQIWKFE